MDTQIEQKNNTFIFDEVQRFFGKYAPANYCGKWGIIDSNGEWLIKPSYQNLLFHTSELIIAQENNLYGIIDINKNVILPFKYECLSFINSENLLIAQKEGKFGIINTEGKIVLPLEYQEISELSSDNIFAIKNSDKWGIINLDNKLLVPFEYDSIRLEKDYFIAEKEGNFGLADFNNNVLIPFIYKELNPFMDGMSIKEDLTFAVKRADNNFVIINSENKIVSEQVFEDITSIGTTLYSAKVNNKTCAIDRFGNIKIPLGKFNTIYCFHKLGNGKFVSLVENDNHEEALINDNGEIIVPFEAGYKTHGYIYTKGDCILMRKDDKFGVIDQNNNVIIPFLYDWIYYENENYIGAKIGDKWGYIDNSGQPLVIKN